MVLTQTWILLTQIKPSQSASPGVQAGALKQELFIFLPDTRGRAKISGVKGNESVLQHGRRDERHKNIVLHRQRHGLLPAVRPCSNTGWIFKYHPEPTVRKRARNWHREANAELIVAHTLHTVHTLILGSAGGRVAHTVPCLSTDQGLTPA